MCVCIYVYIQGLPAWPSGARLRRPSSGRSFEAALRPNNRSSWPRRCLAGDGAAAAEAAVHHRPMSYPVCRGCRCGCDSRTRILMSADGDDARRPRGAGGCYCAGDLCFGRRATVSRVSSSCPPWLCWSRELEGSSSRHNKEKKERRTRWTLLVQTTAALRFYSLCDGCRRARELHATLSHTHAHTRTFGGGVTPPRGLSVAAVDDGDVYVAR